MLNGHLGMVVAAAAIVLIAGARNAGTAAEARGVLAKHEIAVPALPNALCNDGSVPVFYYRPGVDADRNRWVIVFQDGGSCTSDAACAPRMRSNNRYYLSSASGDLPPTISGDGILSVSASVNPDFAGYNHVFLHYCSSDAYAGDTQRVLEGVTWQFRGKPIVDALIETLVSQPFDGGPTLAEATDVLVAGSSAGAMGVHNNIDRIAARLPWAQVKGLVDSAWVPTAIIPFAFGTFGARPDQPAAFAYFNAKPDDSCVAANPKSPGACLGEAFVFPYLTTPTFVYADQRDANILGTLGIAHSPTSDDEADYVTGYAAKVRDSIRASVPAYFAANVTIHNVLLWSQYARLSEEGETFGATLHRWYFEEPGSVRVMAPGPGVAPMSLSR